MQTLPQGERETQTLPQGERETQTLPQGEQEAQTLPQEEKEPQSLYTSGTGDSVELMNPNNVSGNESGVLKGNGAVYKDLNLARASRRAINRHVTC